VLRLYVAASTPNSTRAESNLLAALKDMGAEGGGPELEIVDVFTHPKRALTDGVIVTPTLIGIVANGRKTMMGDLSDSAKLKMLLVSLQRLDQSDLLGEEFKKTDSDLIVPAVASTGRGDVI
jgi:circadian clock protein KaiB